MDWSSLFGGLMGGSAGGALGGSLKDNDDIKKLFSWFGNVTSAAGDWFSGIVMNILSTFGFISPTQAPAKQAIMDGIQKSDDKIKAITDSLKITSPELTASIKAGMQKAISGSFTIFGISATGDETVKSLATLQTDLTNQIALALLAKPENGKMTNDQATDIAAKAAAAITGLNPDQTAGISDPNAAGYALNLKRIAANPPTTGLGGQLLGTAHAIAAAGKDAKTVEVPALTINGDMNNQATAALNLALTGTSPSANNSVPPPGATPPGNKKPKQQALG